MHFERPTARVEGPVSSCVMRASFSVRFRLRRPEGSRGRCCTTPRGHDRRKTLPAKGYAPILWVLASVGYGDKRLMQ